MDAGQKIPEPPKQGVIGTEPTDYEIGSIKDLAFCERGPRDNDSIHSANKAEVYLAIHSAEWSDYNDDEAKAVLHRIDWRLLPLFILTMMLAGMDVSSTQPPPVEGIHLLIRVENCDIQCGPVWDDQGYQFGRSTIQLGYVSKLTQIVIKEKAFGS